MFQLLSRYTQDIGLFYLKELFAKQHFCDEVELNKIKQRTWRIKLNKLGVTANMDRKVTVTKTATRTPPSIAAAAMVTTRTAYIIAPVTVRGPESLFKS